MFILIFFLILLAVFGASAAMFIASTFERRIAERRLREVEAQRGVTAEAQRIASEPPPLPATPQDAQEPRE